MFIKQLKIKSNVPLKSTERKKLRTQIIQKYPISEEAFNIIFPSKASVTQIKLIAHNERNVTVYASDKRPMFFEISDIGFIPTVYALWLIEDLLPYFTTHPNVLPRLGNGADLMLPGVIKMGSRLQPYGHYQKNDIVAVNLTSNKAAIGVGQLARSSHDLYMSGGQGVCVKMLHLFGDNLWNLESSVVLQVPVFGYVVAPLKADDFPTLGQSMDNSKRKPELITTTEPIENLENVDENINELDATGQQIDMPDERTDNQDDLLVKAFQTVLKLEGKKLQLPILTSSFYRCHVLPASSQPIDIKKTSFKKLSKFLQEMSSIGYIEMREEPKGVEKIITINVDHQEIKEFIPESMGSNENEAYSNSESLFVTKMTELYLVTDVTAKFFQVFNLTVGTGLEPNQVKRYLKDYVCNNKLQGAIDSRTITLNEVLRSFTGDAIDATQHLISFQNLLAILFDRMKQTYQMRSQTGLSSGKTPSIQMSIQKRSGNKKVTLIHNLESHGIKLPEFAKSCKLGVAASSTVVKGQPNQKDHLLVQGNQIAFVCKLLTETYKIPPKFIQGADLAIKEKKKKK